VEGVVAALGMTTGERGRDRVWVICPWHQAPDSPAAWATSFFVRTAGTRRTRDGGTYSAAGQYHCFACGVGGSIRDLVRRVRRCSEAEADAFVLRRGGRAGAKVEELRRRVGVVRVERPGRVGFVLPREVVFEPLPRWPSGARAELERRGVTAEEVERFGIGYAVDGAKLGGRIVIPWRDGSDRIGSYSARTFVDAAPKYTTPGPNDHPDRDIVFGEHLWPASGRDLVVVAEGALNAIAAARACPGVAVGAVGGADNYSAGQARRLATFARVLILSDPDPAGDKLAAAIAGTIGRYAQTERVRLPRGQDAEDVGTQRLRQAIDDALERMTVARGAFAL